VTTTPAEERAAAVAAAETTCARCGAPREADQEYCVACGLRLPRAIGTLPSLRRRWVRRLGWYPGDWVWMSLLTLLFAAAGAAAAIFITTREQPSGSRTFVAPGILPSVAEPTTAPVTTVDTATLPTAPEPTVKRPPGPPPPPNGRTVWPATGSGWTVVLVSYPKVGGRQLALGAATRAAKARLPEVGVLDSNRFASLHPGYYVVFSGIYGTNAGAEAALRTARSSGFAGAYSRQITR
jgi:hypothetical protein